MQLHMLASVDAVRLEDPKSFGSEISSSVRVSVVDCSASGTSPNSVRKLQILVHDSAGAEPRRREESSDLDDNLVIPESLIIKDSEELTPASVRNGLG